ncbi:MAG: copper-translocating P-type ATPase [Planctomycetota bacterium]|nr:MAG: copper-translocating P-type ATPase [Planctomycetota bacterium]
MSAGASVHDQRGVAEAPVAPGVARPCCAFCDLPILVILGRGESASTEPLYCCLGCRLAAQIAGARDEEGRATGAITRLGLAIFLTMVVMAFTTYFYGRELEASPETAPASAAHFEGVMRYVTMIFATPVLLLLGGPIAAEARESWRRRSVGTDALILIGVVSAYALSYASTLRDSGPVYFETACVVLVLVTLGRYIEARTKLRASKLLRPSRAMLPATVVIERGGVEARIPTEEMIEGDVLAVRAGERLAADGVVVEGAAHADLRWITGESAPAIVKPGDALPAGALNLDGHLRVRVTAAGARSALGRILEQIDEAQRTKGRYERLADRVAGVFVPLTLVLGAIGGALGYMRGGTGEAVERFLSVLLIACPCALGIATPLAVWAGIGRAAARGVVLRSAEVLEALADIRAAAFDKTGTLTASHPVVVAWTASSAREEGALLALARTLAVTSTHPYSRCVAEYAERRVGADTSEGSVSDITVVPGRGILARVEGELVRYGSAVHVFDVDAPSSVIVGEALRRASLEGLGVVCLRDGRGREGVFLLDEEIRGGAAEALAVFTKLGCPTVVLTGDHAARGERLARTLGVPVRAGLLPDDKIAELALLRARHGRVMMIGDGLNDAPALAAADVGVAMGCGTDLSRATASACLMGDDPRTAPWLVLLGRRTVRTIRVNLAWAFAYNLAGVGVALTGALRPTFAAVAMVISSLLVVGNSMRLATHDGLPISGGDAGSAGKTDV